MKYSIEINHSDDGIYASFRDVGDSREDRKRIAESLRLVADWIDRNYGRENIVFVDFNFRPINATSDSK